MSKLNVLYQSSNQYAPVAMVSMYSMLLNSKDIDEIDIYLINSDISNKNIDKIKKIVESFHRKINFISAEFIDKLLAERQIEKWNGSYATFYKLFIIDYLNVDKILYIDSDTIFSRSALEICKFDLQDNLLGMAYSAMCGLVRDFYGKAIWYNAGIIYFNAKEWKRRQITKQVISAVASNARKRLTMIGDESLINVLFSSYIVKLPLEYNYESSWWLWGWNKRLYSRLGFSCDVVNYYTFDEIKNAQKNPIINHYTALTTGRPWDKYNDNRARKEFNYYYDKLSLKQPLDFYKGTPLKKSNISLFFMRLMRRLMPMCYRSEYGFNLHESAWKNAIDRL